MKSEFSGFPKECIAFYRGLEKNNSKQWFEEHRREYEEHVLLPAREFVRAMGDALARLSPGINADPRTDKSIFRIYRDVRFSRDKRPFKTHLAIWFWEGGGPRMECSGYYFHLERGSLMLGAGIYMFPRQMLREYRDSVVNPKYGPALAAVENGGYIYTSSDSGASWAQHTSAGSRYWNTIASSADGLKLAATGEMR